MKLERKKKGEVRKPEKIKINLTSLANRPKGDIRAKQMGKVVKIEKKRKRGNN